MDAKARQIVEEMQRDGRQTFAQWDPQLFDDISEGPAKDLWVALLGNARTPQAAQYDTLADYLRLVSEAIGNGYLVESANGMDLNNVMASCLRDWIPSRLASVSPGKRAESLSTAWNLCEGVLRQPAWINAYLMTRADEMTDLATLEEFFARLLDPVFSPTADAQWTGSLDFTVIDPSEFDEHFLPGEITPLANRVVSVADRRSRSRLGVLLQKSRQSRCLGHMPPTVDPYSDDPPPVEAAGNRIRVGAAAVDVPLLGTPRDCVALTSGFVVVTAEDSQRIWIVESSE